MSPSWRPLAPADPPDPMPVGRALEALAQRLGAARPEVLGAVFARWHDTVGPALAARTRPVSLVNGVLTIAVDEPAWATELRFLEPTLLRRMAEVGGAGAVTRIEVRVRR